MTQKRTAWSVLVLAALLLVSAVPVFADSKPYFTSRNGSVFAGGWFYDSGGGCNTATSNANYQAPDYGNLAGTRYNGALMAFANSAGTAGANSNLDAMALGLIEGGSSDYGFYSAASPLPPRSLSLSNVNSNGQSAFWGGMLDGSNAKADHCIPDYYNTKRIGSPQVVTSVSLTRPNGQYQINAGGGSPVSFGGDTVQAIDPDSGRELTYFIDGDLYITGNISYGSHTADNVPKLAFVVRGNILVDPGVDHVDGWYIAQPNGANGGAFWSCVDPNDPDGSPPTPKDLWVRQECDNTLRINGAVTARQVNLLRINGGLGSSSPSTSAEIFTYTPEMVIGGPFFNQPPTPGDGIQSLISLPPVF